MKRKAHELFPRHYPKLSQHLPTLVGLAMIVFICISASLLLISAQTTLTIKVRVVGKGVVSLKYYNENNITKYLQVTRFAELQVSYGRLVTVVLKPAKGFKVQALIIDGKSVKPSRSLQLRAGLEINDSLIIVFSPELPIAKESSSLALYPETKAIGNGYYLIKAVVRVFGDVEEGSRLVVELLNSEEELFMKTIDNVTPNYFTLTFSLRPPSDVTYTVRAYLLNHEAETEALTDTYLMLRNTGNNIEARKIKNTAVYIVAILSLIAAVLIAALLIKREKVNI